jgi:Fe-S cluster biogenesis protein NfuA
MARIVMIEPTPNPLAFKLRLDQTVTVGGSRQYNKKEECWDSPVAARFFDVHGVESVFLMDDFITVTKTVGGIWDYIFFQANEILMAAKDIVAIRVSEGDGFKELASDEFEKLPADQKLTYIDRILSETIRPGLARDGGNLRIIGLEENILRVEYQGACGSCPSSTGATLNYISNMLQSRVSPNLQVIPA